MAAQPERRIAIEASSAGVAVHVEPAGATGDVLLTSAGRILGHRSLHDGQAQFGAADLPLGAYAIQASFGRLRSQATVYHAPAGAVTGFSEIETIGPAPSDIKALFPSGRDVNALTARGIATISRARITDPVPGALADSAALGDFDGDGVTDLASAKGGHVEVQLGGRSTGPVVLQHGPDPVRLAAGDFDGDGIADLAIANTRTGEIRVFTGSAKGFLPATIARPGSGSPVLLTADDLDGDGQAELVVADAGAEKISVLRQAKDGWMETAAYSTEGTPAAVAAGDFRGSGHNDVVWLNNDGSVRIAGRADIVARVDAGVSLMSAADVNGDGRMDLVFASHADIRVAYGQPVTPKTAASTMVTKSLDDGSAGTLRYVVTHATAGSTVTFSSPGAFGLRCSNSLDCTIMVPPGVSINGQGADVTFIQGNGVTRIFALQGNSKISNLTLENGVAQGGNGATGYTGGGGAAGMGGAVFVQGAGNQFQNVTFHRNSAIGGAGGGSNTTSNPYFAGGGGGGIGSGGGQGHHASDDFFTTTYDSGGDGGAGGILGGAGGTGGVDATLNLADIGELLISLASLQFEDLGEELPVIIRGIATEHGGLLIGHLSLDTILLHYGIDPNISFNQEPTEGGPGAGGGGAGYEVPFGMAGGYGGGGGGSADPLSGYGGRSVFGGGNGGGLDTRGVGLGGSGYGGAVFVYQGASADFDNCTFESNQAVGGANGLQNGFTVLSNNARSYGGAVFVDVGGQVSYNASTGLHILSGNTAGSGSFSWGAPWSIDGTPGVQMVMPGDSVYTGDALDQAIQGAAAGSTIRFATPSTLTVYTPIQISKNIVIDGQNQVTISGANPGTVGSQLFQIVQGNVTFENITLTAGDAEGGVGGYGGFGGGGGPGGGGAIFIHAGNVTVRNVTFSGNIAIGGVGGGLGGGLGSYPQGGGGGASITHSGQAAPASGAGNGAIAILTGLVSLGDYTTSQPCTQPCMAINHLQQDMYTGGGGGLDDNNGGDGNMFGGGGGAGLCAATGSFSTTCGTANQHSNHGGNGGYGAGGGAGNPGGGGGQFAGAGQSYPAQLGGGGAGMGGAIYLRTGVLTIDSCTFTNNSAAGDRLHRSNSGQGKGGAIFNQAGTIYWQRASTFQGNSAANAAGTEFDNNDIYGALANLTPLSNAPTTNAPGMLPAFVAGPAPQAILARDVNGDFIPDLVVETQNGIVVFPGLGDGRFGAPSSTPINTLVQSGSSYTLPFSGLAAGYLDVAPASPAVTILTAQQSGAYLLPGGRAAGYLLNYPAAGLAIGDLDNDGFDDLIQVGPSNRGILVLLGSAVNGSYIGIGPAPPSGPDSGYVSYAPGQFAARHRELASEFAFEIPSCGVQPFSAVTVGDFNGDGLNDIAAAGADCVLVAYNLGGGDFNIQSNRGPSLYVSTGPIASIVPIPTPDGKISFLVPAENAALPGRTGISAIYGQTLASGQPVFAGVTEGPAAGAATAGDYNRDGNPDVLITYPATNTAALYLGSSVPSTTCFQSVTSVFGGCAQTAPVAKWNLRATPVAVASADFNGDGYADFAIATSDGYVSILMGRAPLNVAVQRATQTVVGTGTVKYTVTITDPSNVSTGTLSVALTTSAQAGIANAGGTGWTCSPAPVVCTTPVTLGGVGPGPITFSVTAAIADGTIVTTALATTDGLNPSQGSDTATVSPAANLQVGLIKSTPLFWVNQQNAAYTVSVSNPDGNTLPAAFTVTIALPAGITATSISATSWQCTLASLTCTWSGSPTDNVSGFPISVLLSINSAPNPTATTTATLSIPGQSNVVVSDTATTTATSPVQLTLTPSSNPLNSGEQGALFQFAIQNLTGYDFGSASVVVSAGAAIQPVSLYDPAGNFKCTGTSSCTFAAEHDFGPLDRENLFLSANMVANVQGNASVTLIVTTMGNTFTQSLSVPVVAQPPLAIAVSHSGSFAQGQQGDTYSIVVTNLSTSAPASGTFTVTESLPAGLSLVSMTGTGWNCATLPVCRSFQTLAAGAGASPITVTVNVGSNAVSPQINAAAVSLSGVTVGTQDPTIVSNRSCDVQRVGSFVVSDLQSVINEALGLSPALHDLNNDGFIGVADVQVVANAVITGTCSI